VEGNKYFKKLLYLGNLGLRVENELVHKIIQSYRYWKLGIFSLTDYDVIEKTTHYRKSKKPILRWIKGDGLDDEITRSAIAQATRLFKDEVDYCICTINIDPKRIRSILAWASEPVEWMPISPNSNPLLARELMKAGCRPSSFGYWWKWFPERVRPWAPEWIMDGDMVIVQKPKWYENWKAGKDLVRVSQSKDASMEHFGEYQHLIDKKLMLYSGIVSLPPNLFYLNKFLEILKQYPLKHPHNGCKNVSEQGVVAAAFQTFRLKPIPLYEFPFAISGLKKIVYGPEGNIGDVWGYHFGLSFLKKNNLFEKLCRNGTIYWQKKKPKPQEKFTWLKNNSQWGIEGSSMHPYFLEKIQNVAKKYRNQSFLEIGTSRGFVSAILSEYSNKITTIDHKDRGASNNLKKLSIEFIKSDANKFLKKNKRIFNFIFIDLHGNDKKAWQTIHLNLIKSLAYQGTILFYNSHIFTNRIYKKENGIQWLIESNKLSTFKLKIYKEPYPGLIEAIYE
jgi:protein-L-isoaspartate O-methyltransferase